LLLATEALLRNKLLPKEQANNLVEAINVVREHLPRTPQVDEDIDFLRKLLDEIAELEKEEEKAKAA
jgi:transposase